MLELKNFAWPVTVSSKDVCDCFMEAISQLEDTLKGRKIVIFGAGIRGTLLAILLERKGYKEFYFTDNNIEKWGGTINNHLIIALDELMGKKGEVYILVSVENYAEIRKQLDQMEFTKEEDYRLLDASLYNFYMKEFHRETDEKVLVMGDCGLTHISLLDENTKNMAEMLKEGIGEDSVKVLAMHGMGMNSFYNILKVYADSHGFPDTIVLMTNFETFTGKQHLLPRSQHLRLLESIYSTGVPDEEFKAYLKEVMVRSKNHQIELVSENSNGNYENLARSYMRYNYMYYLKDDNENILYMQKLIKLLKQNNVRVLIYIPPVNYQLAEKLQIVHFKERYGENLRKLKEILKRCDCHILDFAYFLGEEEFASTKTVDETANYTGRCKVADAIIREILEWRVYE